MPLKKTKTAYGVLLIKTVYKYQLRKESGHMQKIQKSTETKYSVKHALVNYYLLFMFTLFPLFFTQQYANIRHDKYYFFLLLSVVLLITETVFILSEANTNLTSKPKWYHTLSVTDWAMLALFLVYTLSTVFSQWPMDSVTGNQGRNNGLLLMGIYVAVYFAISRCFYFMEYVFGALAVGAGLVFFLAIINYFYIDPLGMFIGYAERYVIDFSATIGNKNLLASFICICLPVLMFLFIHTEKKGLKWLYFSSCILGFSALLTADSDSGFLGFFVFLAIAVLYYIRKINRLKSLFFLIFSMLAGAKLLRLFSLVMSDHSKGFTAIPSFFIYNMDISFVLISAAGILTLILFLADKKYPNKILPRPVFYIALSVFILTVCAILAGMYYYTFVDTATPLNEVTSYLRFNDKWGTHRGYMWRISMEEFSKFDIKSLLFGSGPDTLYSVFYPHFSELKSLYGDASTNCAHNEYINYLVTTGILGLAAYLTVLISFIVRAIRTAEKNPLAIICCAGVVCYSIQAIVNIAQPITTPLFILLICIGEGVCRQVKREATA